jgi:hypothetical protein
MLYTIKKVLVSPGKSTREFLAEGRHRFVKPITFLILMSLIYTIINHFFQIGVKDYALQQDTLGGTYDQIMSWMLIDYPGYSGIITGLLMAFWIKLFFKKSGFNIFEIFILVCFVTGVTTLFLSIVTIFQGLLHVDLISISNLVLIVYFVWAVGQFFDSQKISSYVKAFLSYILGVLVLTFSILFISGVVDALQ